MLRGKCAARPSDEHPLIPAFLGRSGAGEAPPGSILSTLALAAPQAAALPDNPMKMLQLVYSAVHVQDVFGVITFWNREAERLYGWTQREALGRVSFDMLRTKFSEPIEAVQEQLFRQDCWEGTVSQVRRDGAEMIVESRQAVQRDERGRPVAIVAVHRDITQRTRDEQKLRQMMACLLQSQDEERRRIARELHDSTTQILSALGINLAIIQGGLNGKLDAKLSKILSDTISLACRAGDELRNISHLLHPPDLEAVGLIAAIRWYAAAFEKRHGIRTVVECGAEPAGVAEDVKIALFRMVQESLANIQRHSGSKTAKVQVNAAAGEITIKVQDQGKGMQASRESETQCGTPGIGLSGMKERICQLGGRLDVNSSSAGTAVCAVVPLV